MKIKITEEQANRLKLLKEDLNPLITFEQFCKMKTDEINKMYTRVSNIVVAEILNGEINIEQIVTWMDSLELELGRRNSTAYDYIENLPEEDLDVRIDRAKSRLDDKIASLSLIVSPLEKLDDLVKEHNLTIVFSDVKPMDISDIQN